MNNASERVLNLTNENARGDRDDCGAYLRQKLRQRREFTVVVVRSDEKQQQRAKKETGKASKFVRIGARKEK